MKRKILPTLLALVLTLALAGTALAAASDNEVHASTPDELRDALKSNTTIILEGKDYSIGYLGLHHLENVTIRGTAGTRIISPYEEDIILEVSSCKNIVVENVVMGHEIPTYMSCQDGVVAVYDSDLTLTGCDIFGCGLYGIDAYESTLTAKDTTVRDCAERIMIVSAGAASFENCTFSGNGYKDPSDTGIYLSPFNSDSKLTLTNCTFKDNKNPSFINDLSSGNSTATLVIDNCTFTNNTWGSVANTTGRPTTSGDSGNAGISATPTASTVLVDGQQVSFDAYNIGGNNYFKLRDLAYVLNGSDKQFEVSYDAATKNIALTSGAAYTANGSEMASKGTGTQSAAATPSKILLDGAEVSLTAYNIGGNNYFKLRDIGEVFDFGVGWDNATKTITIDTSTGYTPE